MTIRIDSHLHLFASTKSEYRRGVHPLYPEEREALIGNFITVMDENSIDHAVLVSLDDHDDYAAAAREEFPERFSLVGVMNSDAHDLAKDFESRNEKSNYLGFRVWELGELTSPIRKLKSFEMLKSMSEAGVIAWFYSTSEQQELLPKVLQELPDLKVVLNHLGFCQSGWDVDAWGRPRIETPIPPPSWKYVKDLAASPNVSVLFSGQYAFSNDEFPYEDMRGMSADLLEWYGVERLMWASDWPWIDHRPGYNSLSDLPSIHFPNMASHDLQKIMGENAARIFSLKNVRARDGKAL